MHSVVDFECAEAGLIREQANGSEGKLRDARLTGASGAASRCGVSRPLGTGQDELVPGRAAIGLGAKRRHADGARNLGI